MAERHNAYSFRVRPERQQGAGARRRRAHLRRPRGGRRSHRRTTSASSVAMGRSTGATSELEEGRSSRSRRATRSSSIKPKGVLLLPLGEGSSAPGSRRARLVSERRITYGHSSRQAHHQRTARSLVSSIRATSPRSAPEKRLTHGLRKTGGRNNRGRLTCRHRGGGAKRNCTASSTSSATTRTGSPPDDQGRPRVRPEPQRPHPPPGVRRRREALRPRGQQGQGRSEVVMNGPTAEPKPGNNMELRNIPVGLLGPRGRARSPGKGAQLARGAGAYCTLSAKEGEKSPCSRCPLARCAASTSVAARPSARSATSTTEPHEDRQGRPQASHGLPPDGAWLGHEPGRPPDGWW